MSDILIHDIVKLLLVQGDLVGISPVSLTALEEDDSLKIDVVLVDTF